MSNRLTASAFELTMVARFEPLDRVWHASGYPNIALYEVVLKGVG